MKNKPTDSKAGPRMEEMLLIITDFAADRFLHLYGIWSAAPPLWLAIVPCPSYRRATAQ
jgi:hypothetical protein